MLGLRLRDVLAVRVFFDSTFAARGQKDLMGLTVCNSGCLKTVHTVRSQKWPSKSHPLPGILLLLRSGERGTARGGGGTSQSSSLLGKSILLF